MDGINFEVGSRYRNMKGEYEVLEVNPTSLKVRYVGSGEVQELDKEMQSRIVARLNTPPPPPAPVKASRTTTPKAPPTPKTPAPPKTKPATAKAAPAPKAAKTPVAPAPRPAAPVAPQSAIPSLSTPSGIYWLRMVATEGATAPLTVNDERQALIFPSSGSAASRPAMRPRDTVLFFRQGENIIYAAAQVLTEPRASDPGEPLGWKVVTHRLVEIESDKAIRPENVLLSSGQRMFDALSQSGYISLDRFEGVRLVNELKRRANPVTNEEEQVDYHADYHRERQ